MSASTSSACGCRGRGTALLAAHASRVDGCDAAGPSVYTAPLAGAGITVLTGHEAGHLGGVDRVAVSAAFVSRRTCPTGRGARARIPVVAWQAILGELMGERGRLGVAVAGTHGKSTATALLGHLLVAAGHDPTVEGALIPAWGASARSGGGLEFVAEADEYDGNFLHLHPAAVLLTTVEMDHPDVFANEDAVYDMFVRFLGGMSSHELVGGRLLVALAGIRAPRRSWPAWRAGTAGSSSTGRGPISRRPTSRSIRRAPASTCSAGGTDRAWPARNVLNAVGALVMGHELGIGPDALQEALEGFSGASRRLELIADTAGVLVFDDYAHHPTEVLAAWRALASEWETGGCGP